MKKGNTLLIVAMLLLIISPIDLIPDLVPLIGHADDLIYLIVLISQVLEKKKVWRKSNNRNFRSPGIIPRLLFISL